MNCPDRNRNLFVHSHGFEVSEDDDDDGSDTARQSSNSSSMNGTD
jgi:hypothetical protein